MLTRYRMYANINATTNAADTMVVAIAGRIKQVIFNFCFDSITDNSSVRIQLSRSAVGDFNTAAGGNFLVTQAISEVCIHSNFVTSGLAQPVGTIIVPTDDALSLGQSLYINSSVVGTVAVPTNVIIVIDQGRPL